MLAFGQSVLGGMVRGVPGDGLGRGAGDAQTTGGTPCRKGVWMLSRPLLSQILGNEALTRGLGDAEARVLMEWLVEQAEREADVGSAPAAVVQRLCRRARTISCFVRLWCHDRNRGAAIQLAATERCDWPLPTTRGEDPCQLMQTILIWEAEHARPLRSAQAA